MASRFDTAEYVKGLTVAGIARAQAEAEGARADGDVVTRAELELLKVRVDAAAAQASSELRQLRLVTLTGILMLCVAILLLRAG